jgi:hypothetical protein
LTYGTSLDAECDNGGIEYVVADLSSCVLGRDLADMRDVHVFPVPIHLQTASDAYSVPIPLRPGVSIE